MLKCVPAREPKEREILQTVQTDGVEFPEGQRVAINRNQSVTRKVKKREREREREKERERTRKTNSTGFTQRTQSLA